MLRDETLHNQHRILLVIIYALTSPGLELSVRSFDRLLTIQVFGSRLLARRPAKRTKSLW